MEKRSPERSVALQQGKRSRKGKKSGEDSHCGSFTSEPQGKRSRKEKISDKDSDCGSFTPQDSESETGSASSTRSGGHSTARAKPYDAELRSSPLFDSLVFRLEKVEAEFGCLPDKTFVAAVKCFQVEMDYLAWLLKVNDARFVAWMNYRLPSAEMERYFMRWQSKHRKQPPTSQDTLEKIHVPETPLFCSMPGKGNEDE